MAQTADETRPDPDALLASASKEHRGRLKIFLGAAPGVGKTWEMLAAAQRKHREGADVLAGLIETHGRAETAAQTEGLPILPLRAVPYRGQTLQEFDLDAALARRPALLLVDELAHTNAPGLRHAKRWQDVDEILDAGIDVWTTLNVQHLESLNDAVARITGVRVTETLPDTVLSLAGEIELIDLPPAELRQRLSEGRIYRADVAKRALSGFFREGNLAALREMALRRVAQHVDRDIAAYMRSRAIAGPWPAAERVLALVEPATAEAVVRQAARLAEALRAPLVAFHVERAQPGVTGVQAALDLAVQLGGTAETTTNADPLRALLDLAANQNIAHIVFARSSGLRRKLFRQASAFSLHVVPDPEAKPAKPRQHLNRTLNWRPYAVSVLLVGVITGIGFALRLVLPQEAMGFIFTAAIVALASRYGRTVALFAAIGSFLAWNFFFLPPVFTLSVTDPRDVVALIVFLAVGLLTGTIAGKLRIEAEAARGRIEVLRRIALFGRKLGRANDETGLREVIIGEALELGGEATAGQMRAGQARAGQARASQARASQAWAGQAVVLMARSGRIEASSLLDDAANAAADWAFRNNLPTGTGTGTLPSVPWRFLPLATESSMLGVLGVRPQAPLTEPRAQALRALADQGAMMFEKLHLAQAAAEQRAQEGSQKLRTALLSSLSHDLRTPLTAIRGAAETLVAAHDQLDAKAQADLLASIVQDTERMTRFLANITRMARVETGEIIAKHETVALAERAEAAISRVRGAFQTAVNLGAAAETVRADPVLLEQILVNLLENAVKYAPEGAAITISSRREGDAVAISVADEGVGIAAADLPHVFDSFFRAQQGDRVAPGTGLGLAIAKAFAEAMGGGITATSPRPDLPADGLPGTIITLRLLVAPLDMS
jgi:two-component system sensor histidine kinase KdpD